MLAVFKKDGGSINILYYQNSGWVNVFYHAASKLEEDHPPCNGRSLRSLIEEIDL